MKSGIHPKYYPQATVTCACGNSWVTGSTLPEIKTDICSACHPYFTGQMQRIVDSAGQVERFSRRLETARQLATEQEERARGREERRKARQLVEIVEDEEVEPIEGLPTAAGETNA
jgi:large subunit ribosomal protein L31